MRIEIIRPDAETPKLKHEQWAFTFYADWGKNTLYFDHYEVKVRPTLRHKYRPKTIWDRLNPRVTTIETPPIPDDIVAEAKQRIIDAIRELEVTPCGTK